MILRYREEQEGPKNFEGLIKEVEKMTNNYQIRSIMRNFECFKFCDHDCYFLVSVCQDKIIIKRNMYYYLNNKQSIIETFENILEIISSFYSIH